MRHRMRIVMIAAILILAGPGAWAIDASCVGVQGIEARQNFAALDPAEREEYQPIIDSIDQLQQRTAAELAGPEQRLREALTEVLGITPETAEQQAWDSFYRQLPESDRLDQAYADTLRAQFRIHWYEALMIAAASRLPRSESERRVAVLAAELGRTTGDVGYSLDSGDTRPMRQLLGVAAIADRLNERAMADTSSRGLAADSVWLARDSREARTGFDTLGISGDAVEQFREATIALSAAQAQGAAAELQLSHLRDDLPAAARRREIMERGRTESGRRVSSETARALMRHSGAREVGERIARIVPPSSPRGAATPSQRRQAFRAEVTERLREASTVIRTLPACLIGALGGPPQCPAGSP